MAEGRADEAADLELQRWARRLLLWSNFFIEGNRLEPFLAVYLVTFKGWNKVWIGYNSLVMNAAAFAFQTPMGVLLDSTRHKTTLLAISVVVTAFITAAPVFTSVLWVVVLLKAVEGAVSCISLPALGLITQGIVQESDMPKAVTENEVANKTGSFLVTSALGVMAYYLYPDVSPAFYLLGAWGLIAAVFLLLIPDAAIDHDRARNMATRKPPDDVDSDATAADTTESSIEADTKPAPRRLSWNQFQQKHKKSGKTVKQMSKMFRSSNVAAAAQPTPLSYRELLRDPNIRRYAVLTFVYHLANAGVVVLVAQRIAVEDERSSLLHTSALMTVGFMFHAISSHLVGKLFDRADFKRILLVGHSILPLRCACLALLCVYWPNRYALTATQVLDGITAGIYDPTVPIAVSKMTAGTGRYGYTLGFVVTCWRMGHGLSFMVAEALVHAVSYEAAFTAQACMGLLACGLASTLTFPTNHEKKE